MKKKRVVVCDADMNYLERFLEFIETRENCPFDLVGFTEVAKLRRLCKDGAQEQILLVISESSYEVELEHFALKTLILNEGLSKKVAHARRVDKYQQVREIYKVMMELCLDNIPDTAVTMEKGQEARVLGFYSPVKRAMQTTFALALGKSLASRYRVLYVSFEQYAGWLGLLCREGGKDLLDLVYYLKESGERFLYRFEQIEQKKGALSYIPPVYAGQNLIYVTIREWVMLLNRLKTMGKFDFILLDLGDSLQGIFEILRDCEKVFTITLPDGPAKSKIEQYEYLLRMYEYEDVLGKSVYKRLPEFQAIPDESELWTLDTWLQFIRKVEQEDLGIRACEGLEGGFFGV